MPLKVNFKHKNSTNCCKSTLLYYLQDCRSLTERILQHTAKIQMFVTNINTIAHNHPTSDVI